MGISGSIWFFNHSNFKELEFCCYFKVFSIVNTYVFSLQPIPTDPNESFAWKDSTLDRKLKELEERAKKQGDVHLDVNGFDKNIDKSIGNWSSLSVLYFICIVMAIHVISFDFSWSYFFTFSIC